MLKGSYKLRLSYAKLRSTGLVFSFVKLKYSQVMYFKKWKLS